MKISRHVAFVFLLSSFLVGCATAPIQKISYGERLDKPFPSQSLLQLFPERIDLPRDDSYTRRNPYRRASPITRPPPRLPKSITPGSYELYLFFIIESNGTVKEAKIVDHSSSEQVNQACLEMIHSWRFSPTISGGSPIAVGTILPIRIVISNES